MLAYLFWHTPKPTVARSDYERDLLAFSRALADLHCPGVRGITSFRTSTVPWLDDPSGYEDWATIDGSCALETLNEQAVSGSMVELHGTVAQQMGVGYGGVYYHLWATWTRMSPSARNGCLDLAASSFARFWNAYHRPRQPPLVSGVVSWCWAPAWSSSFWEMRRSNFEFRMDGQLTGLRGPC